MKPRTRSPHKAWWALLASWKLARLSDAFGYFRPCRGDLCVSPDCTSDVTHRTHALGDVRMGTPCQVWRGSCEFASVWEEICKRIGRRVVAFLSSVIICLWLSSLEFIGIWLVSKSTQPWCSFTFHFQRGVPVSGPSSASARAQCPACCCVVDGITHWITSVAPCSVSTNSR